VVLEFYNSGMQDSPTNF